jgi:HEAT repeat protein
MQAEVYIMAEPLEGSAEMWQLVDELASKDGMKRQMARQALVRIGGVAVDVLIHLLDDARQIVRWEAARALADLRDSASAPALVRALDDEDDDVRWLAAEGLIALHARALKPLLKALTAPSCSVRLRDGAHHILSEMRRGWPAVIAGPVLEALEDIDPALAVPLAARSALAALEKMPEGESIS